MKSTVRVLVALLLFFLTISCSSSGGTAVSPPTDTHQPTASMEPSAASDLATEDPPLICPPARGEGTVSPAVSLYSIAFVVNGVEQDLRSGDRLIAQPGDEVQVREVTICAQSFSSNPGEACVDFAPATQSGQEVASEHIGTHMMRVIPGFFSIPGPNEKWTIDQDWGYISAVVNHWPPEDTDDPSCGSRRCEHDDRLDIEFQ